MPHPTCLYTVEAEADPQLPARILGLFTQRGLLPAWFSARSSAGALRVVVEIGDMDEPTCELLRLKMLNIPSVLEASRRPLPARAGLAV